jgi:hypothetical protein
LHADASPPASRSRELRADAVGGGLVEDRLGDEQVLQRAASSRLAITPAAGPDSMIRTGISLAWRLDISPLLDGMRN